MKKFLIYDILIYANQIFSSKNESLPNINSNETTFQHIRVPNDNNGYNIRNEKLCNNYSHDLNKNSPIFNNFHLIIFTLVIMSRIFLIKIKIITK